MALHLSSLINGLDRLRLVAPDWSRDMEPVRRLFNDVLGSPGTGHDAAARP